MRRIHHSTGASKQGGNILTAFTDARDQFNKPEHKYGESANSKVRQLPNTYSSTHNDAHFDLKKYDVAQEEDYPRMPLSRGVLVEPSGDLKRISHQTIKSPSCKELPIEQTITQSFE